MLSHITVLSNWLLGYDRYQKLYSKSNIPESTYPHEFYLLEDKDLNIGIAKATKLLKRLNIENDKLLRIETTLSESDTQENLRNGLGRVYPDHKIPVHELYLWDFEKSTWNHLTIEDVTAQAFLLKQDTLKDWHELKPLTLSFLPIAMACQAACSFCFSGSSISIERKRRIEDFKDLAFWCDKAAASGAERFVITGGGEPTIMPVDELIKALEISSEYFKKNIIISNGIFLSKLSEEEREKTMLRLSDAGLSTLSLSYHHYNVETNKKIMGIDTKAERIFETYQKIKSELNLRLRIVTVLQQGGVEDENGFKSFIDKALQYDIEQLCFKELYVASTSESLYSKKKENIYSRDHQVPLMKVIKYCESLNLPIIKRLPWGSPIYRYTDESTGKTVDIAAYTEPSVGWERSSGIARSWNYMADNKCFASLEDESSEVIK